MRHTPFRILPTITCSALLTLASCGGGGGDDAPPAPPLSQAELDAALAQNLVGSWSFALEVTSTDNPDVEVGDEVEIGAGGVLAIGHLGGIDIEILDADGPLIGTVQNGVMQVSRQDQLQGQSLNATLTPDAQDPANLTGTALDIQQADTGEFLRTEFAITARKINDVNAADLLTGTFRFSSVVFEGNGTENFPDGTPIEFEFVTELSEDKQEVIVRVADPATTLTASIDFLQLRYDAVGFDPEGREVTIRVFGSLDGSLPAQFDLVDTNGTLRVAGQLERIDAIDAIDAPEVDDALEQFEDELEQDLEDELGDLGDLGDLFQ